MPPCSGHGQVEDAKEISAIGTASRGFATLDADFAPLERNGAIDLPWRREISPGVHEHVRRMPDGKRETATRAELMKRFGLAR